MTQGRLLGKTAFVTGGGAGIGAASALSLAAHGARVVVTDLDAAAAVAVAAQITAAGGQAVGWHLDVTDESEWEARIQETLGTFGALTVLLNNAGIAPTADLIEDLKLSDWRRTLAVNLDGVFLGVKHGIRAMKANTASAGSIINVSSVYGIVGTTRAPDYVAAKGAVRLLTKAAALECSQSRYPIRVNSIHPGFIETPMLSAGLSSMVQRGFFPNTDTAHQVLQSLHPIGRLGLPTDVAAAVVYLASDESAFMTGSELVIDGGYTAQ